MQHRNTLRARRTGSIRLGIVVILGIVIAGGVFAYQHFFHRGGEEAIKLIPADALVVGTCDLNPSPEQVPLFKRIHDALQNEHAGSHLSTLWTSAFQGSPAATDLQPFLHNNFAFAALKSATPAAANSPDVVFLASVTDATRVQEILAKYGQPGTVGAVNYYHLPKENVYATVLSGYLVVSSQMGPLTRVGAVSRGEAPAIAGLTDYQQARGSLRSDANFMFFCSAKGLSELQAQGHQHGAPVLPGAHWIAFGATALANGVETQWQLPMDVNAGAELSNLGSIPPIAPGLLKKLPAGAYGAIVLSQPAKYWDYMTRTAATSPEAKKAFDDGIASFERETGMSVARDILPGMAGHFVLAVYPDASGARPGADGLIVIDDANGADAAALAAKLRVVAEEKTRVHGNNLIHFVSSQPGGATLWALDPPTRAQLQNALSGMLGGGMSQSGNLGAGSAFQSPGSITGADVHVDANGLHAAGGGGALAMGPNGMRMTAGGMSMVLGSPPPSAPPVNPIVANKTVVYAVIGKAVLIATSQAMLDRALAAYNTGAGSLADDPRYAEMNSMLVPGAQSVSMLDATKIMQEFQPTLSHILPNSSGGVTAQDIVQVFGTHAGIVASQKFDGKTVAARTFIPLDYERLIHIISAGAASASPPAGATPGSPAVF